MNAPNGVHPVADLFPMLGLDEIGPRIAVLEAIGQRDREFFGSNGDWLVYIHPADRPAYWQLSVIEGHSIAWQMERPIRHDGIEMVLRHFGLRSCEFSEQSRQSFQQPATPRAQAFTPPAVRAADGSDCRTVYFLRSADGTGPIKIGVAGSPHRRVRDIQRMSPVRLAIVGVIDGVGQPTETHLHQRFAAHRLWGEWFAPAPQLLAFIAANTSPLAEAA